ncbi:MAG: hypothetical protein L6R42_005976 [Xanthoria sp. 1 TBL-2021]|nr:MAG: hypothetical protein L6R42_005976 [Xanthoria sp. 1 TBL-2021]
MEMIWAVVKANRGQSSAVHQRALSKLINISIDHWDTVFGQDITVDTPFLPLPSIRSLHGRMICGDFHPEEAPSALVDDDNRPIKQSQIEEIKIVYSTVGSIAWGRVLKPIENLKRFTYEHEGAVIGFAQYDYVSIMALLREHACHSLEHPDLACDTGYNEEEHNSSET